MFLFTYLTLVQMEGVLRGLRQALRPGGRFIFTLPHPLFPYLCRQEAPFTFDARGQAYATSRDAVLEGRIWRRDGPSVAVRCLHKTRSDIVGAFARTGWGSRQGCPIGWTAPELAADPSWLLRADGELERSLDALRSWALGREDPEEALVCPPGGAT